MPVDHIRLRNRDAASPANLSLDTLDSPAIADYRSGMWLGPRVTSDELRGDTGRDLEGIAELAARARVQIERSA
jgi:hypothetical protein